MLFERTARTDGHRHELASEACAEETATLRIEAAPPRTEGVSPTSIGPDEVVLSFGGGAERRELGRLDGRYLSTEVATGFTGRMLALGSAGEGSRVRRVSYEPR